MVPTSPDNRSSTVYIYIYIFFPVLLVSHVQFSAALLVTLMATLVVG